MKRFVPAIGVLALAALLAAAGAVFAFRPPAVGTIVGGRRPVPVPVRSQESRLTSAFSYADPQAGAFESSITAPRRVYDRLQRPPGTRRRLAEHNRDFDPAPPDYLLAQGITRVKDAGKRVALTLDDGPSVNTTRVLDILSQYDSHATFFVVGRRVLPWPHLARSVIAQGSELGNHTMDHVGLSKATEKRDQQEILEADDVMFKAAAVHPAYIRPKGGMVDDTGMLALKRLHKTYVYWDVAGFDTVPEFTAADIRDNVLEGVRPGSVILLHETNPRTLEALPMILKALQKRGYKVQSLTELLAR